MSHLLTKAINLGNSGEDKATQLKMYERAGKVADNTNSKCIKPIRAAPNGPPAAKDNASRNDELA